MLKGQLLALALCFSECAALYSCYCFSCMQSASIINYVLGWTKAYIEKSIRQQLQLDLYNYTIIVSPLRIGMFSAVQIQLNQLCMRSTFEFELLFSAALLLWACLPIHHIKVVQLLNSWWKVLFLKLLSDSYEWKVRPQIVPPILLMQLNH